MRQVGYFGRVSNSIKPEEIKEEYDIDHEITATIAEVDNIIESCDCGPLFGGNESKIIKACINHLLDKL